MKKSWKSKSELLQTECTFRASPRKQDTFLRYFRNKACFLHLKPELTHFPVWPTCRFLKKNPNYPLELLLQLDWILQKSYQSRQIVPWPDLYDAFDDNGIRDKIDKSTHLCKQILCTSCPLSVHFDSTFVKSELKMARFLLGLALCLGLFAGLSRAECTDIEADSTGKAKATDIGNYQQVRKKKRLLPTSQYSIRYSIQVRIDHWAAEGTSRHILGPKA